MLFQIKFSYCCLERSIIGSKNEWLQWQYGRKEALAEDLIKRRVDKGAEESIPENIPAYSHQSKGIIERAVQSVQG